MHDDFRRACEILNGLGNLCPADQSASNGDATESFDVLTKWASAREASVLMQELQSVGITAAKLNGPADILSDPHLSARGYLQYLKRDFVGRQPHPSAPWRQGFKPLRVRLPSPTLGEHNKDIFCGILGLSEQEFESLQEAKIIGNKPCLA